MYKTLSVSQKHHASYHTVSRRVMRTTSPLNLQLAQASHSVRRFAPSSSLLCQFVAYLGQQQLKHQTIKCYLSSIRYFQIMQSYPDPFVKDMPRLQYVLRGIQYDKAKKNQQTSFNLCLRRPALVPYRKYTVFYV